MRTTRAVIEGALRLMKAYEIGETPEESDVDNALEALNDMIVSLQNDHKLTWRQYEIKIPVTGETSYLLGPDSDVVYDGKDRVVSTLAPIGQDYLLIDDTRQIEIGDAYRVGNNSGTVTDIIDSTRVDITALTEEVLADAEAVFGEKTITKPLEIYNPVYFTGITEIPINVISREEYRNFPDKTNTGFPNQVYYDRRLNNGRLYVWPVGQSNKDDDELRVMADLQIPFIEKSDIDKAMPFPDNWFEALKYNLAIKLDGEYGEGLDSSVVMVAGSSMASVVAEDTEGVDAIFMGAGEDFY